MVAIPQIKKTLDYRLNEYEGEGSYPRHYLGLSSMGEPCKRALQYSWRWAHKRSVPARIERLFRFGHWLEADIIEELISIGCEVTGTQQRIESTAGHWLGHIDGIIEVPECFAKEQKIPPGQHLFDVKSHNDKQFNILMEKGVEKGFPKYYAQATAYMSHDGIPKSFLYIGINKNDSTCRVIHVPYNEQYAKELAAKRIEVIT